MENVFNLTDSFSKSKDLEFMLKDLEFMLKDNFKEININLNYAIITSLIYQLNIRNITHRELNILERFRVISENLMILIDYLKGKGNTSKLINEFLDNLFEIINSELIRLEYIYEYNKEGVQKGISDIRNSNKKNIKETIKKLNDKNIEIQEELKSQKIQYITILGIFASIVLTFVANLTFINSIFNNADKLDTYKLILIGTFVALFIGNTIYALFAFIKNIVSKEKYSYWLIAIYNAVIFGIFLSIFFLTQPTT